jgi:hypothetical protein
MIAFSANVKVASYTVTAKVTGASMPASFALDEHDGGRVGTADITGIKDQGADVTG